MHPAQYSVYTLPLPAGWVGVVLGLPCGCPCTTGQVPFAGRLFVVAAAGLCEKARGTCGVKA